MSKLAKALTAAAGNAAGESLYVEDVFSTYLYKGASATNNIVNNIDVSGEGGLIWLKHRVLSGASATINQHHQLYDTERGSTQRLSSNRTNAQDSTGSVMTFNSDGFTLAGSNSVSNNSSNYYASWTFRKAEKFFDVVTYTGNGVTGRTVSHNLGSTPGCIIVKNTTTSGFNWMVLHSSVGATGSRIFLNLPDVYGADPSLWNSTNPTSTEFTLGANPNVNSSGDTYVAYLFASDAGGFGDDGSESIIKCGSYEGNGGSSLNSVTLGFEPQWILLKNADATGSWAMYDTMRGWAVSASNADDARLFANSSGAESLGNAFNPTATGFEFQSGNATWNNSGNTFIYIAIRRPMKTPESGTEVFAIGQGDGDADIPDYISNFPVDAAITKRTSAGNNGRMSSRLTGANYLSPNLTQAESADGAATFDFMNGWGSDGVNRNTDEYAWMFKRATGFFDVVAYTGNGTPSNTVRRDLKHNLGVAPELAILKRRNTTSEWQVAADGKELYLNLTLASQGTYTPSSYFNATDFDVEGWVNEANNNVSGSTYIAYLFATLAGVSKVGSYTGNGTSQTIDCGFSNGARFILIKSTSTTGSWWVYDSARGIVAGNDPALQLNSTAAEVTSADAIDPDSSGFIVNQEATCSINANGVSYIFMSIA